MSFSKWLMKKGTIGGSARLLSKAYKQFRRQFPDRSEEEIFEQVITFRYSVTKQPLSESEFQRLKTSRTARDLIQGIILHERSAEIARAGARHDVTEIVNEICREHALSPYEQGTRAPSVSEKKILESQIIAASTAGGHYVLYETVLTRTAAGQFIYAYRRSGTSAGGVSYRVEEVSSETAKGVYERAEASQRLPYEKAFAETLKDTERQGGIIEGLNSKRVVKNLLKRAAIVFPEGTRAK